MEFALPGDEVIIGFSGIPLNVDDDVGFQVQKLPSGLISIGRTTAGVFEQPIGTGNWFVQFNAPAEYGDYLVIFDWSDGVLDENTMETEDLKVQSTLDVAPSALGPIADAAKARMGETFDALKNSEHYGTGFIAGRVEAIKTRVYITPPTLAQEDSLHPMVIDYLGILVALELIPPGIDHWAQQASTQSMGNDPTEQVSYPDRIKALEKIQEYLLGQVHRIQMYAAPLINAPLLLPSSSGPQIDETSDKARVTSDPRVFPPYEIFPYDKDPVS